MQNSVSDSERHCSGTSLDATAPSTRPHVICWTLRIWMKNDVEKRWFVPRCYSRHERTEICRFNLPRPCVVLEEGTSAFTKLFSQARIGMPAAIRTFLQGRRSSTAIGIHVASSYLRKLRGLECRKV